MGRWMSAFLRNLSRLGVFDSSSPPATRRGSKKRMIISYLAFNDALFGSRGSSSSTLIPVLEELSGVPLSAPEHSSYDWDLDIESAVWRISIHRFTRLLLEMLLLVKLLIGFIFGIDILLIRSASPWTEREREIYRIHTSHYNRAS